MSNLHPLVCMFNNCVISATIHNDFGVIIDNNVLPTRTGSKLGISPLMLAAMNGHVPAVKLLLDMGSDINAQIETNRNTALTLACFQGRAEVVSLLLDRKANVEHRAKVKIPAHTCQSMEIVNFPDLFGWGFSNYFISCRPASLP